MRYLPLLFNKEGFSMLRTVQSLNYDLIASVMEDVLVLFLILSILIGITIVQLVKKWGIKFSSIFYSPPPNEAPYDKYSPPDL